jgi:hypothetical protein
MAISAIGRHGITEIFACHTLESYLFAKITIPNLVFRKATLPVWNSANLPPRTALFSF